MVFCGCIRELPAPPRKATTPFRSLYRGGGRPFVFLSISDIHGIFWIPNPTDSWLVVSYNSGYVSVNMQLGPAIVLVALHNHLLGQNRVPGSRNNPAGSGYNYWYAGILSRFPVRVPACFGARRLKQCSHGYSVSVSCIFLKDTWVTYKVITTA